MTTLTLTPKNFGKKMSTIYDAVVEAGKITITINTIKDQDMSFREYVQSGAIDRDEVVFFGSASELISDLKKL